MNAQKTTNAKNGNKTKYVINDEFRCLLHVYSKSIHKCAFSFHRKWPTTTTFLQTIWNWTSNRLPLFVHLRLFQRKWKTIAQNHWTLKIGKIWKKKKTVFIAISLEFYITALYMPTRYEKQSLHGLLVSCNFSFIIAYFTPFNRTRWREKNVKEPSFCFGLYFVQKKSNTDYEE